MSPASFSCPCCGGEVETGSKACPHCGACDQTGWKKDLITETEDFDYESFVEEEFGTPPIAKPRNLSWIWWLTGIVVLAWLIYSAFKI